MACSCGEDVCVCEFPDEYLDNEPFYDDTEDETIKDGYA